MIYLAFKNTAHKTFAIPEVRVKNVSAAWNQLREWRDTIPFDALKGAIVEVRDAKGPINSNRIPAEIIFKANKNGKLEFRNVAKLKQAEDKRYERSAKVISKTLGKFIFG